MTSMLRANFCVLCGTPLQTATLEERERERCPSCGWIHYRQLKAAAGMLVERDGCLLLLRRSYQPWEGTWNIPSGYVEFDEEPARAAERETLEETGLKVRATRLVNVFYFEDDPRGNGLLIVYTGEISGGELQLMPECTEFGYFSPDEIPTDLCGAGHKRAVLEWQEAKQNGS